MADIGKSTTVHTRNDTQSARYIERLLINWGDWQSYIKAPSSSGYGLQPMFKDYIAGYRDIKPSRACLYPDAAQSLDRTLSELSERDIMCLYCHYSLELSSRKAATLMCAIEDERSFGRKRDKKRLRCNHTTFLKWIDVAIDNAEKLIKSRHLAC